MTEAVKTESEEPKKSGPIKTSAEPSGESVPGTPAPPASSLDEPLPSVPASLRRTEPLPTSDEALWALIRNRTAAISFNRFKDFVDRVFFDKPERLRLQNDELQNPLHGAGAYELLKTATQVFLLLECGVAVEEGNRNMGVGTFGAADESSRVGRSIDLATIKKLLLEYMGEPRLPYIQTVINNGFAELDEQDTISCAGVLGSHVTVPLLLELIWSYWHEEAMLVQSMNAISLRFQSRRSAAARDPLAHLELAPPFPLNNLLWGYMQDEQQRLSVPRRAYEYDHHYGLTLAGKAIPDSRPAEEGSKLREAFDHLLYLSTAFFKQDNEKTPSADGSLVLNALKEVHLLLPEGAHNQFGDLPWTARAEMLKEQWILSRPEIRKFLQSRHMTPYREAWMDQVDTMKRLQGWTDVSVTHFNELAIYGEQILLSVRYGNWNLVTNHEQAANWARSWRTEIETYIHSYREVTGADLRDGV